MPRVSFIYRDWFNRYRNKKLICRNPNCNNDLKDRRRTCCSDECQKVFYEYELKHYPRKPLEYAKSHPCNICKKPFYYGGTYPNLELDHIEPFAIIYVKHMIHYQKLKPKHKKTGLFRQIVMKICREANREENLQWICRSCHKKKTALDNGKIKKFKKEIGYDDGPKKLIRYDWELSDYLVDKYGSYYYYDYKEINYYGIEEEIKSGNRIEFDKFESSVFAWHSEYFVFCLMFAQDWSYFDIKLKDVESIKEVEEWIHTETYKQDLIYMNEPEKLNQNHILDCFIN